MYQLQPLYLPGARAATSSRTRPGQEGRATTSESCARARRRCYRLATDCHYFAKPTKTLFNDIRIYFPMSAQDRVYKVVDRYMTFAKDYFSTRRRRGYDLAGNRLECRATTRRGHAVPAHAAAAQRLLPVPPAPRRDRESVQLAA